MRVCWAMGLRALAWSLRRLHVPVGPKALVLEVGSGGNPYPRANVLVDAYEETQERHWEPLVRDRPTVLAFGESLPFRDKAFDFVIAAHVLEHSADPVRFLSELQRVARAGYIETPDAFMERINPYKDHRLEVTLRDGCLLIRKKRAWVEDAALVERYEHKAKALLTRRVMPSHPEEFHVRYFWKDEIRFRVLNPETDAGWPAPASSRGHAPGPSGLLRRAALRLASRLFSQTRRNRRTDLLPLLRCTQCHHSELERHEQALRCNACGAGYEVRGNLFMMRAGGDPATP